MNLRNINNTTVMRWRIWYRTLMARSGNTIRIAGVVIDVVATVAAFCCLMLLAVYIGFEHDPSEIALIRRSLHVIQGIFTVSVIYSIFFKKHDSRGSARWLTTIVNGLIIVLLLASIFPRPESSWLAAPASVLYSNIFLYVCLAVYASLQISYSFMGLAGKRTNPALLMASSFLFFIFMGALALMMPKCTYHGISFIDSIFVSTSAVCITGLTPVDIPSTFTPLGQSILAILFQIGGLGIITFTSFFAIFFTGTRSIYSQLLVRDMVYSRSMNSLLPTLAYILLFTVVIEVIGAVALYFAWPVSMASDVETRIWISAFQAMSAFCNVGFTNIDGGMANPVLMGSNQAVYIVMSVLLFAGAIGFPILVNFKDIARQYVRRMWLIVRRRPRGPRQVHIFDLNTKIVLWTTVIIFILGATSFFLLESGNTMRGMPLTHRIVQSVFNALIPRSGGYSTVNPADFLNVTLLLVLVQMWIGGSSQSLAGGIKVNTVGAILVNLRAIVSQRKGISVFHRNISVDSVRRANAVVTLSLLSTLVFGVTLMLLEPQMSMRAIVFEVVSATFSVGSSLGITSSLSVGSKIVLCLAMFVGRVGLLSLLSGFFFSRHDKSAYYPSENIIIN